MKSEIPVKDMRPLQEEIQIHRQTASIGPVQDLSVSFSIAQDPNLKRRQLVEILEEALALTSDFVADDFSDQ